jgi:isoquinoline 1-oxidoreductase alpha subunit
MTTIHVNGKTFEVNAHPDTPLLWVIREQLGLTGTKFGCGIAQCGACSIHINGEVMRSCVYKLSMLTNKDKITTIEGLSDNLSHPVQQAWAQVDVPQCGYCQSGQLMAASALLQRKSNPTDQDIDNSMTNICRCGTYQRIREAVHLAVTITKNPNKSKA